MNTIVELCRDNGGLRAATVVERWTVDEAEARRLEEEKRPNGFFVRRKAELEPTFRD